MKQVCQKSRSEVSDLLRNGVCLHRALRCAVYFGSAATDFGVIAAATNSGLAA
jgi:hypothetical protein